MRYIKTLMLAVVVALSACAPQTKVLYLQDVESGSAIELPDNYMIRIKPLDQITVVVNGRNPELAVPFNSSTNYNSLTGAPATASVSSEQNLQVLTVDDRGYINIPIIGEVYCVGRTRHELAREIETKIIEAGYMTEPSVNVRFADLTISVLGEVNKPGRYTINRDQMTILEAIALAGDLTIYGLRDDIAVVREVEGKNIVTKLDIRSSEIFSSPCYYLEQNDIVIVNPNKYKAATSEINQNRSFWISLASTAVAVATLVITIIK
jgi:polysaccharide export outer membrane protein